MVTKIIACSDIHIPSLKGIDELKETLTVFIEKCKKIVKDEDGPENVRIVVAGDIFITNLPLQMSLFFVLTGFLVNLIRFVRPLL